MRSYWIGQPPSLATLLACWKTLAGPIPLQTHTCQTPSPNTTSPTAHPSAGAAAAGPRLRAVRRAEPAPLPAPSRSLSVWSAPRLRVSEGRGPPQLTPPGTGDAAGRGYGRRERSQGVLMLIILTDGKESREEGPRPSSLTSPLSRRAQAPGEGPRDERRAAGPRRHPSTLGGGGGV